MAKGLKKSVEPSLNDKIQKVLDKTEPIIKTTLQDALNGFGGHSYRMWGADCAKIWSILIENAGRFCIDHSSDILPQYNDILKALEDGMTEPKFYVFGIREYGVDGLDFFSERIDSMGLTILDSYCYYRKVFVIETTFDTTDGHTFCNVTLKEIKLSQLR